jgi:hypothetical protein
MLVLCLLSFKNQNKNPNQIGRYLYIITRNKKKPRTARQKGEGAASEQSPHQGTNTPPPFLIRSRASQSHRQQVWDPRSDRQIRRPPRRSGRPPTAPPPPPPPPYRSRRAPSSPAGAEIPPSPRPDRFLLITAGMYVCTGAVASPSSIVFFFLPVFVSRRSLAMMRLEASNPNPSSSPIHPICLLPPTLRLTVGKILYMRIQALPML